MSPPLEDGELRPEDITGEDLISEELGHRAFLRQHGLLEQYEMEQDRIIEEGRRARAALDGEMEFEETGSQLELWEWPEEECP